MEAVRLSLKRKWYRERKMRVDYGTGTNPILFNGGYSQPAKMGEPIFIEKGGD